MMMTISSAHGYSPFSFLLLVVSNLKLSQFGYAPQPVYLDGDAYDTLGIAEFACDGLAPLYNVFASFKYGSADVVCVVGQPQTEQD